MEDAVKEAFNSIIKMAALFFVMGIAYIIFERWLLNKVGKRNKRKKYFSK